MKKIKIIHITSGDLWGGAEVQLFHLGLVINKIPEIELIVILFNQGQLAEMLNNAGIPIKIVNEKNFTTYTMFKKIRNLFFTESPCIIHAHGYKESILANFAKLGLRNCSSVITIHGAKENPKLLSTYHYLIDKIDNFVAKILIDKFIFVSKELSEQFISSISPHKYSVINNGISVEKIEEQRNFLSSVKIDKSKINLAMIGRLVQLKRFDLFINAISLFNNNILENLHCYIFGDGPLKSELENLAKEKALTNSITFLGAVENIFPSFSMMDLLVMPSDHEGLPMTLLEAMYLEVPIIAHATGGITELLENGKLGTLVYDHSLHGYFTAINQYLENNSVHKQKAKLAKNVVVEKYCRLYTELCQGNYIR